MSALVLADHSAGQIADATLATVTAASARWCHGGDAAADAGPAVGAGELS